MTTELLKKCLPQASDENILKYGQKIILAMDEYHINTPKRQAAFLAQIAHESGSLRYVRELADGSAYEGRLTLGNVNKGDGKKFKGRGFIQITGRSNYEEVSDALNHDFIKRPADLELPGPAAFSAAWFWDSRGLNALADLGEFEKITRRINGGLNGQDDRLRHWVIAKKALSV